MAKLVWAITCRRVIIDMETNAASYIDAIEGLGTPRLPTPLPPFMVGTLWVRESEGEELAVRIALESPDGKEFHVQGETVVVFSPEHKRFRINQGVFGGQATIPGDYWILVQQRKGKTWSTEARLPLDVSLVKAQQAAGVQQGAV